MSEEEKEVGAKREGAGEENGACCQVCEGNRGDSAPRPPLLTGGRSPRRWPTRWTRRLASGVIALAVYSIGGVTLAEETAGEVNRPPPLPPPTEAQRALGRELLMKIVYVIENVPLEDSAAVLGVFGFKELETAVYPTNTYVAPKKAITRSAIPVEFLGTGLRSLSSRPVVRDPKFGLQARFGGVFNPAEACVVLDDVLQQFATAPVKKIHPRRVLGNRPSPPRANNVGLITIRPLATPNGPIGGVIFGFDYQTCADGFTFSYTRNLPEEIYK